VTFVDAESLPALACTCKTTRDAEIARKVASGTFSLMPSTERYLVEFAKKEGYSTYFQDLFASPTRSDVCPHQKWEAWFAQLGDIGTVGGKVPTSVTAGVLSLVKYGSRAQLEVLANLCGKEEGFDDVALTLEARKRVQKILEKAHEAGEAIEEEVLDGVMALGKAYVWVEEWDECHACFVRAREGFVRLLGKDSPKSINAAHRVAWQLPSDDERIVESKRLWEMARVSLPDEAITYDIANDVGIGLWKKGQHAEAKAFYVAALEGYRKLFEDEHKKILATLNNLGALLHNMRDYEGALDYYRQALTVKEKVLGRIHPTTLMTIMNMASVYKRTEDFKKAEEMYRLALDGREKSLGKHHEKTKKCAKNLAALLLAVNA